MVRDNLAPRFTITLNSEDDTERLGQAIAKVVVPDQVIGLVGTLGAGKTRLTRAIAVALGVDPLEISSPTFVLIQEYEGTLPIFHFDAYRLDSPDAFEALGVSDYWEAGGLCLVEWADLVFDTLPYTAWTITLMSTGSESREVTLQGQGVERVVEMLRSSGLPV